MMVNLTERETSAVALLGAYMSELLSLAGILVKRYDKYKDDLPADAKFIMQGTRDMLDEWATTCYALCEGRGQGQHEEDRLAVWVHPESMERYCAECANLFDTCPMCSGVLRIDQAIQLDTGNYHEACAPHLF